MSVRILQRAVRGHWGIENQLSLAIRRFRSEKTNVSNSPKGNGDENFKSLPASRFKPAQAREDSQVWNQKQAD